MPLPLVEAAAEYPVELLKQKVKGTAVVTFVLDTDGKSKDFSVKATHEEFAKTAIAAARRNKYRTAKKNHQYVPCKFELLYTFPGPCVIVRFQPPESRK